MGDEVEEVAVAGAAEVVRALQALAAAPVEVEVQVPRAVVGLRHPPLLAAAAGMVPAPADGVLV